MAYSDAEPLFTLSQPHTADERVVEALPRPDAVSMASGTICLEYVDTDERDLAFDWLEAHGAGATPSPPMTERKEAVRADLQRIDDALVSCASLIRALASGNIATVAAAELDYVRSALAASPAAQGVTSDLHGPFGYLNGCRGLSEDSWSLESDPLENSDEYFAIPLYALTDPFKEIGHSIGAQPSPQPWAAPDPVEAGAQKIASWLGFAWDGLYEGSIVAKGFPIFTHGQFGWHFQGYKDDLRNLARDILAASHMPVGGGQKYRLLEAGEIIASDDEFIGDDGITWERVKGWPVGSTYTHIFKSCRRPLAAARAGEDGR